MVLGCTRAACTLTAWTCTCVGCGCGCCGVATGVTGATIGDKDGNGARALWGAPAK